MASAPDDDGFDDLFRAITDEAPGGPSGVGERSGAEELLPVSDRGGRWLIAASLGTLLAGAAVLAVSGLVGSISSAASSVSPAGSSASPAATTVPTAVLTAPSTPAQDDAAATPRAGIADLPDQAWITDMAARSRIPPRALRAYAGASMRMAVEQPGCGLGWNTLAGIGFVESEHGTFGGSRIHDDGWTRPGVIGIPLDGTRSMAIRDTDGGALDGDTVWDRAVGPMQFIPSTWAQWGADGDGDGVADPQHIDDAALAAARYLCAAGGDLTDPGRWIAAVAAYNDTVEYNNRVAEAAAHYASLG